MRTLTLGVLIVAGGTLAALPFRRYRTIQDASTEPVQATGPTQSAMEQTDLRMLVDSSPSTFPASVAAIDHALTSKPPTWSAPAPPTRRRTANMPLTYEDLAVPIDQPASVQQRFNATVEYQRNRPARDATAGLVMPRMDSLGLSEQQEIRSRVAVVDQRPGFENRNSVADHRGTPATSGTPAPAGNLPAGNLPAGSLPAYPVVSNGSTSAPTPTSTPTHVQPNGAGSASFASSPLRPEVANLPQPDGQRQRHWIRQPD